MRDCLSDNEISAYVGGDLKNDTEIINHLNSCADCFDQVTTVMSLIDENKDVYEQLNQSYEEMVYKNKFFSFFDSMSKYIADFISDVLMPRKYYALGTAVVVALVVFNTTSFEKTEINEYSAINLAEKYGSAVKNAKINPIWQKEFASISRELDTEPDKKHAFEIGKNVSFTYLKDVERGYGRSGRTADYTKNAESYSGEIVDVRDFPVAPPGNHGRP